jgi:thymidylate synthase
LVAHEFVHVIGDAHIYDDHEEPLKVQIERDANPFPTVSIRKICETIEEYTIDDFIVSDYVSHGQIKMDVRA